MGFRYIGSKNKFLTILSARICEIVPPSSHIVDLMTGTATVAGELRKQGFKVTANDVMTYSYHHARVALMFTSQPKFRLAKSFISKFYSDQSELSPDLPYDKIINALNNVPEEKNYFWGEFCLGGSPKHTPKPRNYFSSENARKIDGIRLWISRLKESGKITSLEHSLLLHNLILAANDVANIAGTYGHHLAKITGRANDPIVLRPSIISALQDSKKHRIYKDYAESIAKKISCDLCYIDPPYMKRQYAANYHILETLAREDKPQAIGVSGLRPWRDQYSNFCTKTKIRESFKKIFKNMKCSNFLISYSEDGLLSLKELEAVFKEFGEVSTKTFSNKRFKSNNSNLKPNLSEYLIYLNKS